MTGIRAGWELCTKSFRAAERTVYWDTAVTHRKVVTNDPDRNLRIFEKLIRSGTELDLRQQFYYGRELMGHGRYEESRRYF